MSEQDAPVDWVTLGSEPFTEAPISLNSNNVKHIRQMMLGAKQRDAKVMLK